MVALLQAGTMRWKAAALGGFHDFENALCNLLEGALGPSQLSLADRGFFSMDRWPRFSGTGAHCQVEFSQAPVFHALVRSAGSFGLPAE